MTPGELEWRLKRTEYTHSLLFKDLRDRCGGKQPPVSGCESSSLPAQLHSTARPSFIPFPIGRAWVPGR